MSILTDEAVVQITKAVAALNKVSVADVVTSRTTNSTGSEAIEIKIIVTPGSSGAIMGERSARTVSQVIQKLADAGDGRSPIVRYEELVATSPS